MGKQNGLIDVLCWGALTFSDWEGLMDWEGFIGRESMKTVAPGVALVFALDQPWLTYLCVVVVVVMDEAKSICLGCFELH